MTRKNLLPWLILLLLMMAAAPAQTTPPPTPTPNPLEACFADLVECTPGIVRAYGIPGGLAVAVTLLVGFLIITPAGELLQEKFSAFLRRFPFFRPVPLPPAEAAERQEDYARQLLQAPQLNPPADPAIQIAAYLDQLGQKSDPLHPRDHRQFVSLAGGLSFDLRPRLGLALPSQDSSGRSLFTEQHSFPDLAEAMAEIDPATGSPYPAFVLLGEPGSGKSTLLRKFARDAVQHRLDDPEALLPVFVSLSDHKSGNPETFLRRHWEAKTGYDGLLDALDKGRVWLFADGLNEMERKGYDQRREAWGLFLRRHFQPGGNRALVACRLADYGEGVGVRQRLLIHPMDETRIRDFLQKRIPDRAEAVWEQMETDRRAGRGDLHTLATVPFWLVLIAGVAGQAGLPQNRAALADQFIETWLDYEAERPRGRALNRAERDAFVQALTRLAYYGLSRSQNYTFKKKQALNLLKKPAQANSLPAADRLDLAKACSLLTINDETDTVRFYHQLFQEYFAGREVAARFLRGRRLSRLWRVPWRRWRFVRSRWDPLPEPPLTYWEEATVLAAGLLHMEDSAQPQKLVETVLPKNAPLASRCVLESGAKDIPAPIRQSVGDALRAQLENPRLRLAARLAAGKALGKLGDPRILAGKGSILLGDEKPVVFIEPAWVGVAPGSFRMGSEEADKLASRDESPLHQVTLTHDYQIGRFPVTVAEYRCFVDAGGYAQEYEEKYWQGETALRWLRGELRFEDSYQFYLYQTLNEQAESILPQLDRWVKEGAGSPAQAQAVRAAAAMSEEGYRARWRELEAEKRDKEDRAHHPWLWDDPRYTVPNLPVIGVCWYEAQAYAAWLTEILQAAARLPAQETIQLPTEAEWEKAARGMDARRWPWGNKFNAAYCNSLEGRVLLPTPVGAYPHGAAPCGALDLAGNVWEWCADWYAEDTYQKRSGQEVVNPPGPETGTARVVRGGSWDVTHSYARCAARYRLEPDYFGYDAGFRLVRRPRPS